MLGFDEIRKIADGAARWCELVRTIRAVGRSDTARPIPREPRMALAEMDSLLPDVMKGEDAAARRLAWEGKHLRTLLAQAGIAE